MISAVRLTAFSNFCFFLAITTYRITAAGRACEVLQLGRFKSTVHLFRR